MPENELKCCISGSFSKFKPEIDLLIDEFRDLGIVVLSPDKGWLFKPRHLLKPVDFMFRPLPSEKGLSIREIEDSFLRRVKQSDFLYIADFEGYVGQSAWMEIGFAFGCGVPCFAKEQIKSDEENDLMQEERIAQIKIAQPNEIKALLADTREKWGT